MQACCHVGLRTGFWLQTGMFAHFSPWWFRNSQKLMKGLTANIQVESKNALSNQLLGVHDITHPNVWRHLVFGGKLSLSIQLSEKDLSNSGVSVYHRRSCTWHLACRQVMNSKRMFDFCLCGRGSCSLTSFGSKQLRFTSGFMHTTPL